MIFFSRTRLKYRRPIYIFSNYLFIILAILFLIFSMLVVVDIFSGFNFIIDHLKNNADGKPDDFHSAIILILTIVLVIGAWRQIHNSNTIARNEFLLRMDERYGGNEIVQARSIIHKIYRSKGGDEKPREYRLNETAKDVEKMRTESSNDKNNKIDDFVLLLNFLDYLETIALFYNKGSIDRYDLEILSGDSIRFYYSVFSIFIETRRVNTSNRSYYSELEKCINDLPKVTR